MKAEGIGQKAESEGLCQFELDGFEIVKSLVEHCECDLLAEELTPLGEQSQKAAKSKTGGVRNLLRANARVSQLSNSSKFLSTLKSVGFSSVFPVRAIFSNKTAQANWRVPWHQDLVIAVSAQIETPGFTGWSMKDGVPHVHAPPEILERMVTLRLHLDDCAAGNGALKVIPGSHRHGKLEAAEISKWSAAGETMVCELAKGDALLMRPLLLHSSSSAKHPSHRRVLHIEYATQALPNGLKWFYC